MIRIQSELLAILPHWRILFIGAVLGILFGVGVAHRNFRRRVSTLYAAIAHGDEEHRNWLYHKLQDHFK